jgi:uncharacterized protein (TIGR03000 family)
MYKPRLALVTAAVLLAGSVVRADADLDIKLLLDKAVKEAGPDTVAKLKNVTWKAKVRSTEEKKQSGVSDLEIWAQNWDRLRLKVDEIDDKGRHQSWTVVMNGKKAWWNWAGLNFWEIPEPAAKEFALRDLYFTLRATQMLPALLGKEFQLTHLGEVKVNDQPAVGLRIRRKGRPDVSLFFDKKTSLPVKAELRVSIEGVEQGIDGYFQVFYSDYKEFNGLKHFAKITFKGAKRERATGREETMELAAMELSDIRPQMQLDASLFDQPPNAWLLDRPQPQPAFVTVRVPSADAEVWFDDHRTQQAGLERVFESPALQAGKYSYHVRAKWRQNGKDMEQTRTVQVQPGQRVMVDFNRSKAMD